MQIYIGADHRGFQFKKKIIDILKSLGHEVVDCGTQDDQESCDYPLIAYKVGTHVAKEADSRGLLVCMSGIGQSIAANKVDGVYAALCYNAEAAQLSREHNNANVLVLSAKFVQSDELEKILDVWLKTSFEGGRHERRFNQIKDIEQGKALN